LFWDILYYFFALSFAPKNVVIGLKNEGYGLMVKCYGGEKKNYYLSFVFHHFFELKQNKYNI
jgi:hypothetical protein